MNSRRTFLAAALAASFALAAGAPAFAADPHAHPAGEPAKLSLDHGKKWATDEPLRKHMGEIRTALAAKAAALHQGTLTADEYKALGTLIETRVASIVTDCKLPPAADANLHLIVAELLAGADAMQGKSKATPSSGAVQAVRAVNQYGKFFADQGFKPIA